VGDPNALAAYNQMLGPPLAGFTINQGDSLTLFSNQPNTMTPALSFRWDVNSQGLFDLSGASVTVSWAQLMNYGVNGPGTYAIDAQVTDGTNTIDFLTTLTVNGPSTAVGGKGGPFGWITAPAAGLVPLGAVMTSGVEGSNLLALANGALLETVQAESV